MITLKLLPKGIPFVKRLTDILLTLPILVILAPAILLISILVAWLHGFPILFKQKRPGYRGEIFTIYKFRTMRQLTDRQGQLLPDAERLTKFGRFLRATSLDELPELINVLKGEMSLVGPRPLLVEYLPRYNPTQFRRHEVLPGITGWAQINGRNAITWQEKFDLDVWYVDHRSLWLDLKIIVRSIFKVLRREGISQPGQATAEIFLGNPPETDDPTAMTEKN
ncbi:MAG: sugar transferase [Brevefilum sp.]|nr:sugar transferase [Brevefilum sp.]